MGGLNQEHLMTKKKLIFISMANVFIIQSNPYLFFSEMVRETFETLFEIILSAKTKNQKNLFQMSSLILAFISFSLHTRSRILFKTLISEESIKKGVS